MTSTRFAGSLLAATALGATLFVGPALAADHPGLQPGTYTIDPSHSYAHFAIGHMGLSTLRGRIDVTDGTIRIGDHAADSRIEVRLDPASVDTGHKARDEHLRDMDGFFDVSKYPEMRFQSTRVINPAQI